MKWKNLVLQFQISLQEVRPFIWRRIQVPATYSFWDFHVAIQDSMGWFDSHLHMFRIKKPRAKKITEIGIPMDEEFDANVIASWDEYISDYFFEPGQSAAYEYDFGDSWEHNIMLEGILLKEEITRYPRCIDGDRACPPEDCGGVHGYQNLLEILADPSHEEYESMVTWLSGWYGSYNPEAFDCKNIRFDNPKERWKRAFKGRYI